MLALRKLFSTAHKKPASLIQAVKGNGKGKNDSRGAEISLLLSTVLELATWE